MKKSEKIEIRVSFDEKQKLSDIAESEGRTVSELVRALIQRYMALNKPMLKKPAWGKLAAVALGGLLLGHLATWGLMRGDARKIERHALYQLDVVLSQTSKNGRMSSLSLEVPVVLKQGAKQNFLVQREGPDYQLTTDVRVSDSDLAKLVVKICRLSNKQCEMIANQVLPFTDNNSTRTVIMDDDGNLIAFEVKPTFDVVEFRQREFTRSTAINPN